MFVSNLFDDCWKGYKQVGGKKKGGKMVPNCVPVDEDECQHGRYYCSTDKKWKCRKGPKKSRMSETVLNPQNRIDDFYAKMKALQDLELDPQVDPEAVKQRKLDLKREFDKLNEDLRDWFGKGKKGGAGGGGWDRYNTKGERIGKCGDKKPGEGKPKCLSKSKAAALRAKGGKKAIANAVKRKRAKDPQTDRPGTGNKPKNVSNNIKEDWKKSVVGVLAGLLMVGNVSADEAVKDAVSIARKAYAMKDYNLEALEGEAKQELFNILRTINGHPNQSKLWPVIKDIIKGEE